MARELLQEMARYWQMRVEEIRTLAGFAGRMDDVEAAEIMLRIAGGYDRLVQKSRRCRAFVLTAGGVRSSSSSSIFAPTYFFS